jgi:TPR repeat protein
MRITATVLILMISLFMAGSAIAGPLEDSTKAYKHGDYKTAYRLIKPLADQGYAEAQHKLGILFEEGQGVPQDYVLAHMWFNLAASRYPAAEQKSREEAIKARNSIASKMTPDQIAEAQKLAREWKPKMEQK